MQLFPNQSITLPAPLKPRSSRDWIILDPDLITLTRDEYKEVTDMDDETRAMLPGLVSAEWAS